MLSAESDSGEYGAHVPLCDTDLGEGIILTDGGRYDNGGDERREDIAVLTSQDGLTDQKISIHAKRNQYEVKSRLPRLQNLCRWRQGAVLLLGVFLTVVALTLVVVGGIKSRQHTAIKLLHIQTPIDLKSVLYLGDENFTFAQLMSLTNIALDRPASQSTIARPETDVQDIARHAVDGNLSTCSVTGLERRPEWQVDLQRSRPIKSVRIHGSNTFKLQDLVVRVTPVSNQTSADGLCGRVRSRQLKGSYARVECEAKTIGRYVVIALDNPGDSFQALCLCEVMVYTTNEK